MNQGAVNPFSLFFDLGTGLSKEKTSTKRYLADLKGMFADDQALDKLIEVYQEPVYEFYELDLPQTPSNLLFGTSIVYPGKVGNEYFMTKGHYHSLLETAEVYYCLQGQGYLLMENPEGDWAAEKLIPGQTVYVPPRYAHRSINTGTTPLITFFVFRADAGHNYGTIAEKGFRKLIVEENGAPVIVDNPKWKHSSS